MLTCLYHMFLKQEDFNLSGTDYSAIPDEILEIPGTVHKNTIKHLEKKNFKIILPVATA